MNGKAPTLISGVPKLAPSAGEDQVARQRDPERAREHVPAGRAQRRLAELADQLEHADEALGAEVLVDQRPLGREAAQVRARGERALVGGAQHHAARRLVVAGPLERRRSGPPSSSAESALRVSGSLSVIVATPRSSTS